MYHSRGVSLQVSEKPTHNLTLASSLCELKTLDFYTLPANEAYCQFCKQLNTSTEYWALNTSLTRAMAALDTKEVRVYDCLIFANFINVNYEFIHFKDL